MRNSELSGWVVAALLALVACGKDSKSAGTVKDLTPNGLGVVCTKDTDCEGELKCHLDSTDTTDDRLCTAPCSTEADCHTQFAEYTTCTGVHVCVVTCETSDDCTTGTVCDSHKWCQRGGPDSGVQVCEGTVAACSTVSTQAACEAARCTWGGTCSGTPTSCNALTTAEACKARQDCDWYSNSQCGSIGPPTNCSNYATEEMCASLGGQCACSNLSSDVSCQAVSGCTWGADGGSQCSGTPAATTCGGCTWKDSCTGTSAIASCDAAGITFCSTTPGCELITQ